MSKTVKKNRQVEIKMPARTVFIDMIKFDDKLSINQNTLLKYLYDQKDENNKLTIKSVSQLARDLNKPSTSVARNFYKLVDYGYIVVSTKLNSKRQLKYAIKIGPSIRKTRRLPHTCVSGTKEYIKNCKLVVKYGITYDQYIKLCEEQDNKCAICGKEEYVKTYEVSKPVLSVDHNHSTKEIRGLLCSHCNKALGGFKDNIEILQNAINYLQKEPKIIPIFNK